MKSFFFNAEPTTDLDHHPTGYDREYDADSMAAYLSPFLRTAGVFVGDDPDACKVTVQSGTTLAVHAGCAYVKGRCVSFDGTETVVAAKSGKIVIRCNNSQDVRDFQLLAVGSLIQAEDIYDLELADVQVTAVTGGYQAAVTDTRTEIALSVKSANEIDPVRTAPVLDAAPEAADYVAISDTSDGGRTKRTPWSRVKAFFAGRSVAGKTLEPTKGAKVVAGTGAEIFNDYQERSFGSDGSTSTGNVATGQCAHAEGQRTTASGNVAHAEGNDTTASGVSSHAEGGFATASGSNSHAEGNGTKAKGMMSHAEGVFSEATGPHSHAEGSSATASGADSHAEGNGAKALKSHSHAEGSGTTASGDASHAEGADTKALGVASHAEGAKTTATGTNAHAEGFATEASGDYSHAEGFRTKALAYYSHAEGQGCLAKGNSAHAAGFYTIANEYQYVIGNFNKESTNAGQTSGDRFIIGGTGYTESMRGNCFRVNSNGSVYGGTYNSSGADYAEYFEWADGNAARQDRAGLFVTLDGEKLRLAGPEDEYILGLVSAVPSVVGDVYDDQWAGMYLRDVFGRTVMEERDFPAETAPDGTVLREAFRAPAPKLNPDYRPEEAYLPRSQRPEWDAVGLMGKLVAVDDGTCKVNGFCKVGPGGVAIASETPTAYRVLSRLDGDHVRILVR